MRLHSALYQQFVSDHIEAYRMLCNLLGVDWTTDRVEMAKRVKAAWWGEEHGKLPEGSPYDTTDLLNAHTILLSETNLFEPQTLPDGRAISRRIMTGVKFPALLRRWQQDFPDGIPNTTEMLCSFGSRKRRDDLDGTLDEIRKQIEWTDRLRDHAWIEKQYALGQDGFAREFELGILSLLITYGDRIQFGNTGNDGATQYLYLGNTQITVVDSAAVARQVGYQRPTSASAMQVLIDLFPPKPNDVLELISGAPHTVRVPLDAAMAMWNTEIGDDYPYARVEVYATGSVNPEFINPPVDGAADRRPYAAILGLGEMARFAWMAAGLY